MLNKVICLTVLFFCLFVIQCSSFAREVVIKIRAVNPLDKMAETQIKEYLPKGVAASDIIKKGNFKVTFDKEKNLYYVEQKVSLKPKEVKVFEVELKDIWTVSAEKIEALRKDAKTAFSGQRTRQNTGGQAADSKGQNTKNDKLAAELYARINKNLDKIATRQPQNTITRVGPDKHMEEYWKDADSLKQVEADIKMLKTLLEKKPETSPSTTLKTSNQKPEKK